MPAESSSSAYGVAGLAATGGSAVLQSAQNPSDQVRTQVEQALREAARAREDAMRQAEDARRQADRAVREARRDAIRAGQPVITVPPSFPPPVPGIPPEAVMISIAFFIMCAVIAIGFPIARAIARRMDRKSLAPPAADADVRSRLERIEHAVDAIAVEVERISEGQRFTTRVLADLRALPEPAATPSRPASRA